MIRIAKVALENTADYHTFEFFEHTTIVEFRKQIRDSLELGAIHFDLLGTDGDGDITFVSTMKDLQENCSDVTLRLHLAKKNGNPSKTEETLDPASSSTILPQLKVDLQGTPIKSYPFCHHQHHHHHKHYCAHSSNDASFQRPRSGIQSAELVDDEPDTPIILNPGQQFKKTWTLRNDGQVHWPADSMLIGWWSGSSQPFACRCMRLPLPGQAVSLTVETSAPSTRGLYYATLYLFSPEGMIFRCRPPRALDVIASGEDSR
ncbi:hypothetical protein [Absidia glauca]|uniref:Nbr1 FW domain-containing protein n=1 Tax=Absidia glauca TaxID=4829 RepID=A0A168MSU0_ABSGL|nr:hypothetical protein [Absidia glauca]